MPKITAVEAQKHTKGRYNIYIDDAFAFGVYENTLLYFNLFKGTDITPQLKKQIIKYDLYQKLYLAGLNFISYKLRSEQEVADKLRGLLEPSEDEAVLRQQELVLALAIRQLKKDRYLDDDEYARLFVQEALEVKQKGAFYIKRKLQEKGIAPALIEKHLDSLAEDSVLDQALSLAEKYAKRQSHLSARDRRQKTRTYLLNRGFTFGQADATLARMDFDPYADKEAIKKVGERTFKKYAGRYQGYELQQQVIRALLGKGFHIGTIRSFISTYMEED